MFCQLGGTSVSKSANQPLIRSVHFTQVELQPEKCMCFKKGSLSLRKTLFQIMDGLIKRLLMDAPVYAFMDEMCSEGKT